MITFRPIVTSGQIVTPPPMHTWSPMFAPRTGAARRMGYLSFKKVVPGPMKTRSPITVVLGMYTWAMIFTPLPMRIRPSSVHLWCTTQRSPIVTSARISTWWPH